MSLDEAKAFLTNKKKSVMEDGVPPGRTSQDLAFQIFVAENWKQALTLLETGSLDRRQRDLIVVVAEVLPAQDYVQFLNGVCDLIESEKLKEMPDWNFGFGSYIKDGFLDYNYDHPEVAALINRLEALYKIHKPEQWESCFSGLKSGEAKKSLVKERTMYGDPMPETYKANSKIVYKALVKGHKEALAEEAKQAKKPPKPEPAPRESKVIQTVDEHGRIRVSFIDERPEKKPAKDNVTLPLLMVALILSGVLVLMRKMKRK